MDKSCLGWRYHVVANVERLKRLIPLDPPLEKGDLESLIKEEIEELFIPIPAS